MDGRNKIFVRNSAVAVASGYHWKPFSRDFATLRLPEPINTDSPFSLRAVMPEEDVAGQINIAGFSASSGGARDGKSMFVGKGSAIYTPGSEMLDYTVNTEGGNSGGPAWVESDTGERRVLGVHLTERGTQGRARIVDADFV